MADYLSGINPYKYGINNNYYNKPKNDINNDEGDAVKHDEQAPQRTDVKPEDVLNFLATSSVKITSTPAVIPADDAATAERIDGYLQNFEMVWTVISQEFGEDIANTLMNDDDFLEQLMGMMS